MKRGYILPLLSLLFVSCDKGDDLVNSGELANSTPISIEVSQKAITRGAMVNDESTMGSVGLFCAYTGQTDWSSTTDYTNRMYNVEYSYKNGNWSSPDAAKWKHQSITDKFSFNAYSPYMSDDNGIDAEITNGEICINYIMPTVCENQPDLMIATPRKNIYPQMGGKVHLEFNHMLAAIGFKLKGETTLKLVSVTLKDINDNGCWSCNPTTGESQWRSSTDGHSFAAGIDQKTATATAELVTKDNGYIMAIPQTPPSGATVEIGYSTTTDETVNTKTLPLPAGTEWEAAHQYLYTITLENPNYITIEVSQWDETYEPDYEVDEEDGYEVGGYDKEDNISDTI